MNQNATPEAGLFPHSLTAPHNDVRDTCVEIPAQPTLTGDQPGNQLFYVAAKTDDGDSQDLHVVAGTASAATEFWRAHFELEPADKPEWVRPIPGVAPTREPGPIGWEVINPAL